VNVSGRAEPGAIVFVNGIVQRTAADGTFYRTVTLSGGSNAIVVRAEDAAGNAAERTVVVNYVAPSNATLNLATWLAVAAILAVLAGLGAAMLFGRGGGPEEGEEEAPEEEAAGEEETPAKEEAGGVEVAPAGEEPVVAPPGVPPAVEDRAGRIEAAYREGRISREAYERNLRALGREPPPEAPAHPSPPAPVASAAAPSADEKAARLRQAFDQGKITREMYGRNLLRALGLEEDPQAANLARGFAEGRLNADLFERNLKRLAGKGA
jgi:hypothetical protein